MTTKRSVAMLTLALGLAAGSALAQYDRPQGPPPPGYPGYGHDGDRDRDDRGWGGWQAPPQEYREWQRRGFQDGVEGARRDVENRRRPNVNNRDEYRHPNVPGEFRRDYRWGFQRGYNVAMQHMLNGPGMYDRR